jgi:hypothetical protein
MTIAITLQTQSRTHYSHNMHRSLIANMPSSSSSASSSMKVHPYRKLQRYRSSDYNMVDDYNCHRPQQQQILPNGFTIIPMLSLHADAKMNYHKQQQQQQSNGIDTSRFHTTLLCPTNSESSFSRAPFPSSSSCASLERRYYEMRQQSNGTNTIFPSLTTVVSSHIGNRSGGYALSASEESSMSSSNSMSSSVLPYSCEQQRHESHISIQQPKKHVRFAPTATVHTRSVSNEDLYNSWYDANDYINFEIDNRETVSFLYDKMKQVTKSKTIDELSKVSIKILTKYLIDILNNDHHGILQYQILGLEQFIFGQKHMLERRKETMEHSLMVLEMYDVQRTMQHYNPDVLRRVSERYSYTKVDRAIRRAQFCCNQSAMAA